MEDTAAANDEFIKIVSIGKSYEGREMNVIEIRKAGEGKPNVWIEAGMVINICKLTAAIQLINNNIQCRCRRNDIYFCVPYFIY